MTRSISRSRIALIALALGVLAVWCVGGAAEPATVSLTEGRAATLAEVAALVQAQTHQPVTIESPAAEQTVWLAAGDYPVDELLEAVGLASGLEARRVGETRFLGPPTPGVEPPGAALSATLAPAAWPWLDHDTVTVDLAAEGLPFTRADFLPPRTRRFEELTAAQQALLLARATRESAYGTSGTIGLPQPDPRRAPLDLTGQSLRLGYSWTILRLTWQPRDLAATEPWHWQAIDVLPLVDAPMGGGRE